MTDFLPGQENLFDDPLVGIQVEAWHSCQCGQRVLTITKGATGPHGAMLGCPRCLRNAGWLRREAVVFVTEVIKQFGRPTEPILVRENPSSSSAQKRKGITNAREVK